MKIIRTIDGRQYHFELDSYELAKAYEEQEFKYDVESVRNRFGHQYSEEKIEAIASETRRQINKYDLDFDYALEEAVGVVESRERSVDFFAD